MPPEPRWYQRVDPIIQTLGDSTTPVLDRLTVEQLFQVGRRQALRIMQNVGGFQAGRTSLVRRECLLDWLSSLARGNELSRFLQRKQRIWQLIRKEQTRSRLRSIAVQAADSTPRGSLAALPPEIDWAPGRLQIVYSEPVELLGHLHTLIHAISQDYHRFQALHALPTRPLYDETPP